MQRIYYLLFSAILGIMFAPPIWASGLSDESGTTTTTTDVSATTTTLYQDTDATAPNYLDRRHALVGPHCMVNRLGGSLAKVITVSSGLENLVDTNLTNYVSTTSAVDASIAMEPSFSVKDMKHTYAKGTTAGFVISMTNTALLNLKAIGLPYQIWFYKNGQKVDTVHCEEKSASLLSLKLLQVGTSASTCEVTARTTKSDFDEIALCYTGGVKADVLSNSKIYYAFVGKNGKYYLDSQSDMDEFKKAIGYTGTITVKSEEYAGTAKALTDDSGNIIDTNTTNSCKLVPELGVAAEADVILSTSDGTNILTPGMTVGFQTASINILKLGGYSKMRLYQYANSKYTEIGASGASSFNLLGLSLGEDNDNVTRTITSGLANCNAFGYSVDNILNLGGVAVQRAYIVLPPSLDLDDSLSVSADRSLCDENDNITLHSSIPVTWTCTSAPTGVSTSSLTYTYATDKLSCVVSGFKIAGNYVFTATADDGTSQTTKVTYGISPIIDTAIRPWVNNFTEKGVSYSTDGSAYMSKYNITSFSLIPEITTGKNNLVTPTLDDYASAGGISLLNDRMICGVFRSEPYTYPADSTSNLTVGFVTRVKWTAANVNVLNGMGVTLYNQGKEVSVESSNQHVKVLSADVIGSESYVTTEYSVEVAPGTTFDAITLWNTGVADVNISGFNIYYAFVEPSAMASSYSNSVASTWQLISHDKTGASIDAKLLGTAAVANVATTASNLTNIIDDDLTTYASIAGTANVVGGYTIPVKLGRVFDGGHQVQIITSNMNLLNVDVATVILLKAYRSGTLVSEKANWNVVGLNLLGGVNNESEILWTPTDDTTGKPVDFDEITISFNGVASVANDMELYGIRIADDADGDGIPDVSDDASCDNPYLIDENEDASGLTKTHDFVHGRLNLRRYMKPDLKAWPNGQWYSICLPVDLTFNQFVNTFGNNAVLAKPENFEDAIPGTLLFDIGETYGNNTLLAKNTPYIIRLADKQSLAAVDNSLASELTTNDAAVASTADSVYVIQGVDFYSQSQSIPTTATDIDCVHSSNVSASVIAKYPNATWHGTFKRETPLPSGFYTFSADGYLTQYIGTYDKFRGLRCWMTEDSSTSGSSSAKAYDINILGSKESVITGIHDVTANTQEDDGSIYAIDGQLVRRNATTTIGLPSGLYIWNHKKVIIK